MKYDELIKIINRVFTAQENLENYRNLFSYKGFFKQYNMTTWDKDLGYTKILKSLKTKVQPDTLGVKI